MKKNTIKLFILAMILFIGVAYAAYTVSLSVSGTAKITVDNADFTNNIIFTDANGTGATATISADKKSITVVTSANFTTTSSSATVTFKIANNSRYNARVSTVVCDGTGSGTAAENFNKYLTVTSSRTAEVDINSGASSNTETLTIKMAKTYPADGPLKVGYKCTFTATAK